MSSQGHGVKRPLRSSVGPSGEEESAALAAWRESSRRAGTKGPELPASLKKARTDREAALPQEVIRRQSAPEEVVVNIQTATALDPEQRAKWFTSALEAVAAGIVRASDLFDVIANQRFVKGLSSALAAELLAKVRKSVDLFPEKLQEALLSPSWPLAEVASAPAERAKQRLLSGAADLEDAMLRRCAEFVKANEKSLEEAHKLADRTMQVELSRSGPQQVWGLTWSRAAFQEKRRILEGIVDGTPAGLWNQERLARNERPLKAGDELIAVGGRHSWEEMAVIRDLLQAPLTFLCVDEPEATAKDTQPAQCSGAEGVCIEPIPVSDGGYTVDAGGGWRGHANGEWLFNTNETVYFHLPTGALFTEAQSSAGPPRFLHVPGTGNGNSTGTSVSGGGGGGGGGSAGAALGEAKTAAEGSSAASIAPAATDIGMDSGPRLLGSIRWFSRPKGFGFIRPWGLEPEDQDLEHTYDSSSNNNTVGDDNAGGKSRSRSASLAEEVGSNTDGLAEPRASAAAEPADYSEADGLDRGAGRGNTRRHSSNDVFVHCSQVLDPMTVDGLLLESSTSTSSSASTSSISLLVPGTPVSYVPLLEANGRTVATQVSLVEDLAGLCQVGHSLGSFSRAVQKASLEVKAHRGQSCMAVFTGLAAGRRGIQAAEFVSLTLARDIANCLVGREQSGERGAKAAYLAGLRQTQNGVLQYAQRLSENSAAAWLAGETHACSALIFAPEADGCPRLLVGIVGGGSAVVGTRDGKVSKYLGGSSSSSSSPPPSSSLTTSADAYDPMKAFDKGVKGPAITFPSNMYGTTYYYYYYSSSSSLKSKSKSSSSAAAAVKDKRHGFGGAASSTKNGVSSSLGCDVYCERLDWEEDAIVVLMSESLCTYLPSREEVVKIALQGCCQEAGATACERAAELLMDRARNPPGRTARVLPEDASATVIRLAWCELRQSSSSSSISSPPSSFSTTERAIASGAAGGSQQARAAVTPAVLSPPSGDETARLPPDIAAASPLLATANAGTTSSNTKIPKESPAAADLDDMFAAFCEQIDAK